MKIFNEQISHPNAWIGKDVSEDRSWHYQIDDKDIGDFDTALAAVSESGLKSAQFGSQDFPLPHFGPKLAAVSEQVRNGLGFALLRGFPTGRYDMDQIKTIYWGMGVHLGTVISNNSAGDFVSPVVDQGIKPFDQNRRNNTTNQLLDPHTDLADMVILLCLEKAKEGGMSSLASTTAIHNVIQRTHPEYLPPLYEGFVRDFRGDGYTGDANEVTAIPVPVFEYYDGKVSCAFARKIILDGARKAGIDLSPFQMNAINTVHDLALSEAMRIDMMLEPGDIQIISNYTILHSRSEYVDHDDGRKRYLLRMWINFLEGARLSPEFAEIVRRGIPAKTTGC